MTLLSRARWSVFPALLCVLPLLAAAGCDEAVEDVSVASETDTGELADDETAGEPSSEAAGVLELASASRPSLATPVFQMPVFHHQKWRAATYTEHLPNPNSIDLSKVTSPSLGQVVVASAAGTVAEVGPVIDKDTGVYFGDYVYIDHGDGWQTRYLHIVKPAGIVQGVAVVRGQRLGTVGQYNTMGVHLHYTQVKDGAAVRSSFNGVPIDVHKDAVDSWGNYPTQDLVSNNAPTGIVQTSLSKGNSVKCSAGAGVRAVVYCENSNDLVSVLRGPLVAAGETSSVSCPGGYSVVDRDYEVP